MMLIDKAEIERAMTENWGWLLTSGVIDLALGTWSLVSPVSSTFATELTFATALAAIGILNVLGVFFSDYKVRSLFLGVALLGLSYLLFNFPLTGAISVTSFIAYISMADGLYRIIVAAQNKDLPQRGWTGLGGLVSVGWGLFVLTFLPLTSITTLGSLLGVFLITIGLARISAGWTGRQLEKELK